MIQIRMRDELCGFKLEGHADYNPGNDIVCSAVSMLVYAYSNYVTLNSSNQYSFMDLDDCLEIMSWNKSENIKGAYEMTKMGFKALALQYPDNVELISA